MIGVARLFCVGLGIYLTIAIFMDSRRAMCVGCIDSLRVLLGPNIGLLLTTMNSIDDDELLLVMQLADQEP